MQKRAVEVARYTAILDSIVSAMWSRFFSYSSVIGKEDLRQAGYVGMLLALNSPSVGVDEEVVVRRRIYSEMMRAIREVDPSTQYQRRKYKDPGVTEVPMPTGIQSICSFDLDCHDIPSPIDSPVDELIKAELRGQITEAVSKLRPNERAVVQHHFLEELTQEETGNIMHIDHSRVSRIKKRALRNLQTRLGAVA